MLDTLYIREKEMILFSFDTLLADVKIFNFLYDVL